MGGVTVVWVLGAERAISRTGLHRKRVIEVKQQQARGNHSKQHVDLTVQKKRFLFELDGGRKVPRKTRRGWVGSLGKSPSLGVKAPDDDPGPRLGRQVFALKLGHWRRSELKRLVGLGS